MQYNLLYVLINMQMFNKTFGVHDRSNLICATPDCLVTELQSVALSVTTSVYRNADIIVRGGWPGYSVTVDEISVDTLYLPSVDEIFERILSNRHCRAAFYIQYVSFYETNPPHWFQHIVDSI